MKKWEKQIILSIAKANDDPYYYKYMELKERWKNTMKQVKREEESFLTKLKKKFCRHNYKMDHEDIVRLSCGDDVMYRIFVCTKCGKVETHQIIIDNK